MEVIWPGGIPAQAIYAAASLKVADALAEGTRTVADLAQEVGADEPALARLLRALASIGLFCEDQEGGFRNSELSHMLRTDHRRTACRPLMRSTKFASVECSSSPR